MYGGPWHYKLAVRKIGHLNIKTNMFNFEARVMIGCLANTLDSQPIRMRASMSNIFVFMLRRPIFLTASIVLTVINEILSDPRTKI